MPNSQTNDALARRNALILTLAAALAGGNASVLFVTIAIVGSTLAPDKSIATLPVSFYAIGLALASLPVGWMVERYGRRTAYVVGSTAGILTGICNMIAVIEARFWLLCLGALFAGFYASAVQSYRFAAADTASPPLKPQMISWVLFGGLASAFVGPQLALHTKDWWLPYTFAATYAGQAALAALAMIVVSFVNIPITPKAALAGGRALGEIIRQPRFIAAVTCGAVSYVTMNYVMTAAPLAMVGCDHSFADASYGIQWHIIGMFGPSLITGKVIARYGSTPVTVFGFILLIASAGVALHGITVAHFWLSLVLLGLGWNFGYIGATAMVTECHRPEEKARVQSFNDLIVFSAVAVGSLTAGYMQNVYGWAMVNLAAFPLVILALLSLALGRRQPEAKLS